MGSWVGLSVIMQETSLKGLIISGSSKFPSFIMILQKLLIKISTFFSGKYATNPLMEYITDRTWNKKFKPNRTTHDWVSSDPRSVDNYINDDLCGFHVTNSMWGDIAYGCTKAFDTNNYINAEKTIPIMLISGSNDPVSDFGKGMKDLHEMLNKIFLNIQNISIDKDRHEVFSGLKKDDAYNSLRLFLKNIA
jgi:alpha-beta hydrolase superfamily lysophospholipase